MQMEQGQVLPIAYASRKLVCECKYATEEKECLAMVWDVQKITTVFVWTRVHFRNGPQSFSVFEQLYGHKPKAYALGS